MILEDIVTNYITKKGFPKRTAFFNL